MPQKRRRHSRPLAKIGASALSLLLVASMWPGIGFADDVQAGSGEPESAQQEAAPSEPSPLGKVAIPENSFGYDSQISLASQNEGEGGSFDNRRRQRIRRWLRPSSWERCRIRSGRNPGRGRPHHPKGGYRNRPESFQSRGKRTACRQFPELRQVRRDVLPRPKRHPVENVHRLRGNQEVGRHAHRG